MSDPLVRLLVVEDRFALSFGYVVVVPDFDIPVGWKNCSVEAEIRRPDGTLTLARANLHTVHFLVRDLFVPASKRWRVQVNFPGLDKDDLPVGSEVRVPKSVAESLGASDAPEASK